MINFLPAGYQIRIVSDNAPGHPIEEIPPEEDGKLLNSSKHRFITIEKDTSLVFPVRKPDRPEQGKEGEAHQEGEKPEEPEDTLQTSSTLAPTGERPPISSDRYICCSKCAERHLLRQPTTEAVTTPCRWESPTDTPLYPLTRKNSDVTPSSPPQYSLMDAFHMRNRRNASNATSPQAPTTSAFYPKYCHPQPFALSPSAYKKQTYTLYNITA